MIDGMHHHPTRDIESCDTSALIKREIIILKQIHRSRVVGKQLDNSMDPWISLWVTGTELIARQIINNCRLRLAGGGAPVAESESQVDFAHWDQLFVVIFIFYHCTRLLKEQPVFVDCHCHLNSPPHVTPITTPHATTIHRIFAMDGNCTNPVHCRHWILFDPSYPR